MEGSHEWISRLIAKNLSGCISREEQARLEEWISASRKNELLFERIKVRSKGERERSPYPDRRAVLEDWNKVEKVIGVRRRPSSFARLLRYVAVFIALAAVVATWQRTGREDEGEIIEAGSTVVPARSVKAILVLSDGTSMNLGDSPASPIYQEGIEITRQGSGLEYGVLPGNEASRGEIPCNTILVPRGCEYSLMLSDGTRVILNSGSELRFPVYFPAKERIVHLKGEAFFEVEKDHGRPFAVRTIHDVSIKVLGTRFNVCAYEDDPFVVTTLEEGRVEMRVSSEKHVLSANQQAVLDTLSKRVVLKEVDARVYTAWREGHFTFEDETLESIMNRISRWYNVNVFYRDESVRHLRFSGDLERYDDVSTALRMLEKVTSIKINIYERNVVISVL